MIAFAATAIAAGLQAASCDWGVGGKTVKNVAGENYGGVMYYVVNTSDANWNQATVVAALTDGSLKADDLSGKSYFVESKQGNTASKSAGAVNSHPVSNAAFKDQSEYALAYIIFDTNAGKDYFLISGTQPATAYIPDTTEGTAASFGATSFTGGTGWTEVTGGSGDVPEPLPSASRPSTRQ